MNLPDLHLFHQFYSHAALFLHLKAQDQSQFFQQISWALGSKWGSVTGLDMVSLAALLLPPKSHLNNHESLNGRGKKQIENQMALVDLCLKDEKRSKDLPDSFVVLAVNETPLAHPDLDEKSDDDFDVACLFISINEKAIERHLCQLSRLSRFISQETVLSSLRACKNRHDQIEDLMRSFGFESSLRNTSSESILSEDAIHKKAA